jgi:TetR/AcrR family transcriptional regulator, cholesterol catabolism regulator
MASRGQIEQVAVRLFAARGFAATGIREIGREVGLNSATLYHYAGGKEELLVGVMRTGLLELIRIGREAVELSTEPAIQLARLVRAHVGMEAVNPLTSRVTDREVNALTGENRRMIVGLRDDYELLPRRVLERGAQTGQFQVTDLRVARFAVLEMCNGVANWYRAGGRLSVPELQDRFVELTCRMTGTKALPRADCGPEIEIPLLDSEPRVGDEQAGASA